MQPVEGVAGMEPDMRKPTYFPTSVVEVVKVDSASMAVLPGSFLAVGANAVLWWSLIAALVRKAYPLKSERAAAG